MAKQSDTLAKELRELAAECGDEDPPDAETLQSVLEKAADMIESQAQEIEGLNPKPEPDNSK